MLTACTAMTTVAKDPYLVYKVCSFHCSKGEQSFLGIVFVSTQLNFYMMRNLMMIICGIFLLASCTPKNQGMLNMPSCLAAKIDSIKKDPTINPPTLLSSIAIKAVWYIM
jgi:hypothetical protein